MLTTASPTSSGVRLRVKPTAADREIFLEGQPSRSLSPAEFYCQQICRLPGVEAILQEYQPDVTHFITILAHRDLETREKIYAVEMEMFAAYPHLALTFSVSYLPTPHDVSMFLKHRHVLFQK